MTDYNDIISSQLERYHAARATALSELDNGRLNYDQEKVDRASDILTDLENRIPALERIAQRAAVQQQQAAQWEQYRQDTYGLNPDQLEAARICGVSARTYAEGLVSQDHKTGRWQRG